MDAKRCEPSRPTGGKTTPTTTTADTSTHSTPYHDYHRIMSLFPDRTTDGTLHHAILIAVGEIERLRKAHDA